MKKLIPKLIFVAVLVVIVLGGKFFIDQKTVSYAPVVNKALTKYYVSNNVAELQPIIELLDEYKTDETIRANIQEYSMSIIGTWFTQMDNKYFCDASNLNACKAQLSEFTKLLDKLIVLYEFKCEDGFTILLPSNYRFLKAEAEDKIAGLQKVIARPSAGNPKDSETIRLEKCNAAVDCTNCRDNKCTCYYVDENKNREPITCIVQTQ